MYVGSTHFNVKSHYVEFITLIWASMFIAQKKLNSFFLASVCLFVLLSICIIDVHTCLVGLNVGRISMQNSFSLLSTEGCVWPGTKQSTQFKHFPEYFLANTVHFVRFEYFVNHLWPWVILLSCPSVAAIISLFFCTDKGEKSFNLLHVVRLCLSACRWLCFTVDLVIAYVAFAWLCQIKSCVLVEKCYKSSQRVFILQHTHQDDSIVLFTSFHCHSNILIALLCLFACSVLLPTFLTLY